jgi:hypothetical protein
MATKRAYVYKVIGFIDSYKVYPAVVVLEKGDDFELVNTVADHDAVWTVPGEPFDGGEIKKEKVSKKGRSSAKKPKAGILAVEYEVEVDGKKATANSDPVIIIDAP